MKILRPNTREVIIVPHLPNKKIPRILIIVKARVSFNIPLIVKVLLSEVITSILGSFANAFNLPPDSLVTVISQIVLVGDYELTIKSFGFCYLPLRYLSNVDSEIPVVGELGSALTLASKRPAKYALRPA